MTGTVSSKKCRFCRRPVDQHVVGCPQRIGTKVAMEAWEYGYREGLREIYIPEHQFKTLHPSRVCGYHAGQTWMDEYYDWKAHDDYDRER